MHHNTSFYYSSSPKQDAEKDDNIHIDNHNNGIGIDVNSNDINNDKKKNSKIMKCQMNQGTIIGTVKR